MDLKTIGLRLATALVLALAAQGVTWGQKTLQLDVSAPGIPGLYGIARVGQPLGFEVQGPMRAGDTLVILASPPGRGGLGTLDEKEAWVAGFDLIAPEEQDLYRGQARVPVFLDGMVLQLQARIAERPQLRSETYTLVVVADRK